MPKEMAHSHLGMVTDGRFIYVVTGQYGPQCRGPTAQNFVLDTETKEWCDLPPLPVPRYAPATQLCRGRLHLMGGSKEDRHEPGLEHWSLTVKDGKALEKEWRSEIPIPRGGPHRSWSGSLASSQQIKHGTRDSGNKIVNTNTAGSAIFVPPLNVTSKAHATNPGLNQVPASYFGALKYHRDQSHSLLTSYLDSQSEQFVNSLVKTPVHGNIPNDVLARQNSLGLCKYLDDGSTCLGDNPNSAIQSFQSSIQ